MWPSGPFSELSMRRLKQHGFPHAYEHVCYEGAGHTLGPPYLPTTMLSAPHPVVPATFAFGGTPLANARAREDAWPRALAWVRKALG